MPRDPVVVDNRTRAGPANPNLSKHSESAVTPPFSGTDFSAVETVMTLTIGTPR